MPLSGWRLNKSYKSPATCQRQPVSSVAGDVAVRRIAVAAAAAVAGVLVLGQFQWFHPRDRLCRSFFLKIRASSFWKIQLTLKTLRRRRDGNEQWWRIWVSGRRVYFFLRFFFFFSGSAALKWKWCQQSSDWTTKVPDFGHLVSVVNNATGDNAQQCALG